MATIWDAGRPDLGSLANCRGARCRAEKLSRLMAATPYEILTFVGRGTSARDNDCLKAGLERPEPFSSLCITYSAVCSFACRRLLSR